MGLLQWAPKMETIGMVCMCPCDAPSLLARGPPSTSRALYSPCGHNNWRHGGKIWQQDHRRHMVHSNIPNATGQLKKEPASSSNGSDGRASTWQGNTSLFSTCCQTLPGFIHRRRSDNGYLVFPNLQGERHQHCWKHRSPPSPQNPIPHPPTQPRPLE